MSSCWSSQEFLVLQLWVVFSTMGLVVGNSAQKAIKRQRKVTKPSPCFGSGQETIEASPEIPHYVLYKSSDLHRKLLQTHWWQYNITARNEISQGIALYICTLEMNQYWRLGMVHPLIDTLTAVTCKQTTCTHTGIYMWCERLVLWGTVLTYCLVLEPSDSGGGQSYEEVTCWTGKSARIMEY